MTYSELKKFFESTQIPDTLDGSDAFYGNLPHSINRRIRVIELEMKELGEKIKNSPIAMQYKSDLIIIKRDLERLEL